MMPIDLGQIIYPIIIILLIIGFVAFQLVYHFWYLPAIARAFAKAKHKEGVPAFIQDETGKVGFYLSDKSYPEGIIHHKGKGWFMLAKRPYENLEGMTKPEREHLKQLFIKAKMEENPRLTEEDILEEWEKLGIDTSLTPQDKKEIKQTIEKLIQAPILKGFGKQVFFGSTDSIALTNLKVLAEVTGEPEITAIEETTEKSTTQKIIAKVKTIAYANLRNNRLVAPIMFTKTQLAALEAQSIIEGQKMAGRDVTRIVLIAIAVIGVVATVGIIAWLLTNSGG